ncbi:MAG: 50S ribosomal protein L10 [Rhabdochlamydiaceae bacterium]|nr:50S ribosomal protein L10 [Rhabdochlamydiaceae bacterium]
MRAEKQFLLDEIKDKMTRSKALVLTSYKRLQPNVVAGFRSTLSQLGGSLEVVRKRVLLKAAQVAGVTIDADLLEGHIAVIFADEDPVQTTKAIYQFCKENEEILRVLGGRFEGAVCSAQDVEQISKLPSKDEMRAQFLGTLEAPMSQTLAVMEALLSSVMHCLENKSQQSNS